MLFQLEQSMNVYETIKLLHANIISGTKISISNLSK